MKQIVPFTKKISFNTNIDEITSISLDKKTNEIKDGIISGVFNLYLEYKESDISVNVLKYNSSIPFDIDIDEKYDLKNVKIDIDDFYYEIDGEDVILHIDVLVDNLEYVEEEINNIVPKREEHVEDVTDTKVDIVDDVINFDDIELDEENRDELQMKINDLFEEIEEKIVDVNVKDKMPIYETFDPKNETYVTYNVHIVREEDNLEVICSKYGVSKEELSYYNDISLIKLGDKLIVPTYKK